MSNTKHTPGPWQIEPEFPFEVHKGHSIAVVKEMVLCEDESLANAALISAAPDLLEALEAFRAIDAFEGWHPKYREAIEKAEAAIAKATGTT